jgi:hypothetical protein
LGQEEVNAARYQTMKLPMQEYGNRFATAGRQPFSSCHLCGLMLDTVNLDEKLAQLFLTTRRLMTTVLLFK